MTLQDLQKYLDVEKWSDSERLGGDMCGRYARCRYCNRYKTYPCAEAHNRFVEVKNSEYSEDIPAWLIPEPPVEAVFGTDVASDPDPDEIERARISRAERTPVYEVTASSDVPVPEEEKSGDDEKTEKDTGHVRVISARSARAGSRVKIAFIVRKAK